MLEWLHLETIGLVIIAVMVVFFWLKGRKKKYTFEGFGMFTTANRAKSKVKKRATSKMEEKARVIFEEYFGVKFRPSRPNWLKNPTTGKNLELDGFNQYIRTPIGKGVAFEYDGQQHAKYTPHYHKSGEEFVYQCAKDDWKDVTCRTRGVLLVRIPHYILEDDLKNFIVGKLQRAGVVRDRQ